MSNKDDKLSESDTPSESHTAQPAPLLPATDDPHVQERRRIIRVILNACVKLGQSIKRLLKHERSSNGNSGSGGEQESQQREGRTSRFRRGRRSRGQ